MNIPFNQPCFEGKELVYIADAVNRGKISGDGYYTAKCQDLMQQAFHAKKILLTTSCTSALEMTAMLCDIQPGDEVIMPSFTFVSTVNAFLLRGATPVFIDIRPDTKNMDENLLEAAITKKTKAIVPVHYAGVSCEMDSIIKIADRYNIPVIEDAAQGVNATYNDQFLGTIGSMGAFSFHETKNYISGEGGAIIINDPALIERAEIIREKGTNRSKFFRGEVDKYTWVDIGSSLLPSDILAAFLYAQLEHMDSIAKRRKATFDYYYEGLKPLAEKGFFELPVIPDHCVTNYHMFYLLCPTGKIRDDLMYYLKSKGIGSVFHYIPLHSAPMGLKVCKIDQLELPVTDSISACLLRLPMYHELEEKHLDYVLENIRHFYDSHE